MPNKIKSVPAGAEKVWFKNLQKAREDKGMTQIKLAMEAGRKGGNLTTAFNAANEKAVAMFLDRKIAYLQITEIIEAAMGNCSFIENPDVEEILKTEQEVYEFINSRW